MASHNDKYENNDLILDKITTKYKGYPLSIIKSNRKQIEKFDEHCKNANLPTAIRNLSKRKMDCLQSLEQIAAYEQNMKELSASLDRMTLKLSPATFPAGFISGEANIDSITMESMLNNCVFAVRESWNWLRKANYCLQTHLYNNAHYHQFYHELNHIHIAFNTLISHLQQQSFKEKTVDSFDDLIIKIKEVTKLLLNIQIRVNDIRHQAHKIVPVHLRTKKLDEPIKALVLVDFEKNEVKLSENEEIILQDNSTNDWKVKTKNGAVLTVPSFLILIPPLNQNALDLSKNTNVKLQNLWKNSIKILEEKIYLSCLDLFKSQSTAVNVKLINTNSDSREIVKSHLKELINLFKVSDTANKGKILSTAQELFQEISNQPLNKISSNNDLLYKWDKIGKTIKGFKELKIYANDKRSLLQSNEVVTFENVDSYSSSYVTKAYVQKVESSPKHMTISEKTPVIMTLETPPSEYEVREDFLIEETSTSEFTRNETRRYSITGVIDPATKETISLGKAKSKGILDEPNGLYVDSTMNMTIPIPEAMEKGLIMVAYTTRNDYLTEIKEFEVIDYKIGYVYNWKNGEKVPLEEALKLNIIDSETNRFQSSVDNWCSLNDAIDTGFIEVVSSHKRPRKENMNVFDETDSSESIKIDDKDYRIWINSVFDYATASWIDYDKSVEKGLIFKKGMLWYYSYDKTPILLEDAIINGDVQAQLEPNRFEGVMPIIKFNRFLNTSLLKCLQKNDEKLLIVKDFDDEWTILPVKEIMKNSKAIEKLLIKLGDGSEILLKTALEKNFVTPETNLEIDRTTGCICIVENENLKTPVNCFNDYLQRIHFWLEWITEMNNKNQGYQFFNNDENELELQKMIDSIVNDVNNQKEKLEELIETSQKYFEGDTFSNLKENALNNEERNLMKFNISELRMNWAELQEKVDKIESDFNNLKTIRRKFERLTRRIHDWENVKQEELLQVKQCCIDFEKIDEAQECIKTINGECVEKQNEYQKLSYLAKDFQTFAKIFSENNNNYQNGLDSTSSSFAVASVIESELARAHDSLENVVFESNKVRQELTETGTKHGRYLELNKSLVPTIKQLHDDIKKECLCTNSNSKEAMNRLENLKKLANDVVSTGKLVEEFEKIGSHLQKTLADLECQNTPKSIEISENVEYIIKLFRNLQTFAIEGRRNLAKIIDQNRDTEVKLTKLDGWLNDMDKEFNENTLSDINLDKIAIQLQKYEYYASEIAEAKIVNDFLFNDDELLSDFKPFVENIRSKFLIAETNVSKKAEELSDLNSKVVEILNTNESIGSWINLAKNSIKKPTLATTNDDINQTKISEFSAEKQQKQTELDSLKSKLLNIPLNTDILKENIYNVQEELTNFGNLLLHFAILSANFKIDEYTNQLEDLETEIQTVHPTSMDPESLREQLEDQEKSHKRITERRNEINRLITKCSKIIRQAPSSPVNFTSNGSDEIVNDSNAEISDKLERLRLECEVINKLSSEKLESLREAVPLAMNFTEEKAALESQFAEFEANLQNIHQSSQVTELDELKKCKDEAKNLARRIEDSLPHLNNLLDDGKELMDLYLDDDATEMTAQLDSFRERFKKNKDSVREKVDDLDAVVTKAENTDLSENIDNLCEDFYAMKNDLVQADPINNNPEVLQDKINDLHSQLKKLDKKEDVVNYLKVRFNTENGDSIGEPDVESATGDLLPKLSELDTVKGDLKEDILKKLESYEKANILAKDYKNIKEETIQKLDDIDELLHGQENQNSSKEKILLVDQQEQLKSLKDTAIPEALKLMNERDRIGNELAKLCGNDGKIEIRNDGEEIKNLFNRIEDDLYDRNDKLKNIDDANSNFDRLHNSIMNWLPKCENRFSSNDGNGSIGADPRSIRIQIEELKVLKAEVYPRCDEIQNFIQVSNELRKVLPVDSLINSEAQLKVDDIRTRWNRLINGIQNREDELQTALVSIGELSRSCEDIFERVQQTESDLQSMDDNIDNDGNRIEGQLRKLRIFDNEIKNIANKLIPQLEKVIEEKLPPAAATQLLEQLQDVKLSVASLKLQISVKKNNLEEELREIHEYIGDLEDYCHFLINFSRDMRTDASAFGHGGTESSSLEAAEKQAEEFYNRLKDFEKKEMEIEAISMRGSDLLGRCKDSEAKQIKEGIKRLSRLKTDAKEKAEKKKAKLENHLQIVREFYLCFKEHTEWLLNAEQILKTFKYPSKLVKKCLEQIEQHTCFVNDIDQHKKVMENLDLSGTYLKYYGRKADTIHIKNFLTDIRLRWKKLVRKADERGRSLRRAYNEDELFDSRWRYLCTWITEGEERLKCLINLSNVMTNGTDNEIRDAAKESTKIIKMFQNEMASKHPIYYSTVRLGRSLKERCTKDDPERTILSKMLDELKSKWAIIRSIAAQRQNKLDELLLAAGRLEDLADSLLDWFDKAQHYLSKDQETFGDLDTVNIMLDHHKAFDEELNSKENVINSLLNETDYGEELNDKMTELANVWSNVKQLNKLREEHLNKAHKLAIDFNESVQIVREWLPGIEHELKFKPLPEADESALLILHDKHQEFIQTLLSQETRIKKIRHLASVILKQCHPNAVKYVKYYLTITGTRWDQAISRCEQRTNRLNDALKQVRGQAATIIELLAWVNSTQTLLSAKEKDSLPNDLTIVESLLKEHLDLHDELTAKQSQIDKIINVVRTTAVKNERKFGEYSKKGIKENALQQRANLLLNKWRTLWRCSVDRKKRLQDNLDALIELEGFKNFDFDLWRKRYINWIKAQKLRITDFFRRQDRRGQGFLSRSDFVEGMIKSRFPTNRTELNAVFDIFDRDNKGELDYTHFVDALRPERVRSSGLSNKKGRRQATDSELIHDEVERQTVHCQCRQPFKVEKISDGKYKFGEKKICLVRFLNNTVMVRVGGGWVTLATYLEQNDPCRSTKINSELRENFILPDGASQTRAAFTRRRQSAHSTLSSTPKSIPGTPNALSRAGSASNLPTAHGQINHRMSNPISVVGGGDKRKLTKSCASLINVGNDTNNSKQPPSSRLFGGSCNSLIGNGKVTPPKSSRRPPHLPIGINGSHLKARHSIAITTESDKKRTNGVKH